MKKRKHLPIPPPNRLAAFVGVLLDLEHRLGPDACWPWPRTGRFGYGVFWDGKNEQLAHRVSWRIGHPDGDMPQSVLHRCDNPPCVNRRHLFDGTQADNVNDAIQKGRWVNPPAGEAHHSAKLTAAQARTIRTRTDKSMRGLAREYGVTHKLVGLIKRGEIWRNA